MVGGGVAVSVAVGAGRVTVGIGVAVFVAVFVAVAVGDFVVGELVVVALFALAVDVLVGRWRGWLGCRRHRCVGRARCRCARDRRRDRIGCGWRGSLSPLRWVAW